MYYEWDIQYTNPVIERIIELIDAYYSNPLILKITYTRQFTPERIIKLHPNEIFVLCSNLAR